MKKCNACGMTLDESEFYCSPNNADGLKPQCKLCYNTARHGKDKRPSRPQKPRAWDEKRSARQKMRRAMAKGIIAKRGDCHLCRKPAHRLEAHHEDYMKPLDVIWLCPTCHKQLHAGYFELLPFEPIDPAIESILEAWSK